MSGKHPDKSEIVLVQYPGFSSRTTLSPPCAKVHMALKFKDIAYTVRNLNTPMQAKKYNRRGRLPVLLIGQETIVDSTDILSALDERFPEPRLMPEGSFERARVKILEDWADEVLYFYDVWFRWCDPGNAARLKREVLARLPAPFRWIVPPLAAREVWQRMKGQGIGLKEAEAIRREYGECLDSLVDLLGENEYLVGNSLTRADLAVCAVLDQLRMASLTPREASEIEARQKIVTWMARVHELLPNAAQGKF